MIPMSSKSTPKGMRDFLPEDMILRNEVFAKIEAVYRKYGYRPLETPAMEYLETLRAKAGEDIEGEIFEIVSGSGKKTKYGKKRKRREQREQNRKERIRPQIRSYRPACKGCIKYRRAKAIQKILYLQCMEKRRAATRKIPRVLAG